MILSGVQFLLLIYLFVNDLAEQSVPLFELDKNHVLSMIEKSEGGVCPFVVSPSFLLADTEYTVVTDFWDDKFRKLSFVDNGLNFSFVHGKLRRYFCENFGESFEKFAQRIAEQLSFSHFFEVIFKSSSTEVNRVAAVQLWVLYIFVLVSVYSLWNYKEQAQGFARQRLLVSAFGRTRFLVVIYAVGKPSNNYRTVSSVDAQDTAFFFIWSVTIGLNYFMTTLFNEWRLRCNNNPNSPNYRIFKGAYILYLACVVIFATTLLSYIVLPRSRFIPQIYSIMLVSDALRLVMNSLAEILRTIEDRNNEIYRFGITTLNCCSDLFESVFIGSGIYHGLFVRRRLITIALCSYNSFVINRFMTLDYPEFQPNVMTRRIN